MEKLIEAIKAKNLVKSKKLFSEIMKTKTDALVEEETKKIASQFHLDEEETDDTEDDAESTDGKVDDKKLDTTTATA